MLPTALPLPSCSCRPVPPAGLLPDGTGEVMIPVPFPGRELLVGLGVGDAVMFIGRRVGVPLGLPVVEAVLLALGAAVRVGVPDGVMDGVTLAVTLGVGVVKYGGRYGICAAGSSTTLGFVPVMTGASGVTVSGGPTNAIFTGPSCMYSRTWRAETMPGSSSDSLLSAVRVTLAVLQVVSVGSIVGPPYAS